MKKLAFIVLALVALEASAQQDTLKYRTNLKDKAAITYSLKYSEKLLSEKAIACRQRQQLPTDSTDLSVCPQYVGTICDKGVKIVVIGKWDNFVIVSYNDSIAISEIAALPSTCVTEKMWIAPPKPAAEDKHDSLVDSPARGEAYHDSAFRQTETSSDEKLHEAGFKGQDMTIAVISAGYHNVDKIDAMKNIRIPGTKDFVEPGSDIYAKGPHGMVVLPCMVMSESYVMVGTALEASHRLFRSEDEVSEHLVEQDYWAAIVEFADSAGVDVVNTSLGYFTLDDSAKNYKHCDLDGHHALMSRQASEMVDKGIILVCSAGNSGASSWKKITAPGDAENVLIVGAIDRRGMLASFSSIGNTAGNRMKPDVVVVELSSDVMGTNGDLRKASGTSLASSILCGMVTRLWRAYPQLTAKEVIELVRQSGDRVDFPDNIYGYGVFDLWKAYQSASKKK